MTTPPPRHLALSSSVLRPTVTPAERQSLRRPPTGRGGYHGFVALERVGTPPPGGVCTYRVISSYDSMLMAIAALNEVATYDGAAEKPRWPSVTPGLDAFARGHVLRPVHGTPAHGTYAIVYWPEPKDAALNVPIEGGVVNLTLARRTFEYTMTASMDAVEAAQERAAWGELSPREKETNADADAELCACGHRKEFHNIDSLRVCLLECLCDEFRGTGRWPSAHAPTKLDVANGRCVCTHEEDEHGVVGCIHIVAGTASRGNETYCECKKFNPVTVTTLSPPADRPAHLRAQDAAMGAALARGHEERELDAEFTNPRATHARPGAFKSWIALEEWGHTAHLKLDYDTKHSDPQRRNEPREGEWQVVFAELAHGRIQVQAHQGHTFDRCIPHKVAKLRAYTTRRGLHVRVWLRTIDVIGKGAPCQLTDAHLLQLHARLNDDPVRQAFNAKRVARGAIGWCVLWTTKYSCAKVLSREEFSQEWTDRILGWLGKSAR